MGQLNVAIVVSFAQSMANHCCGSELLGSKASTSCSATGGLFVMGLHHEALAHGHGDAPTDAISAVRPSRSCFQ